MGKKGEEQMEGFMLYGYGILVQVKFIIKGREVQRVVVPNPR